MVEQIEYTLLEPINISVKGEFKKVSEVILKAPKGRHVKYIDEIVKHDKDGNAKLSFEGVLKLLCCGDIMFTKEHNIALSSDSEFRDLNLATINALTGTYIANFNFFSL